MRSLALILVLFLTGSASAQQVYWEGWYAGKFYPGRYYSASNLCCNKPGCGMRQDILARLAAQEAKQAVVVPAVQPQQVEYITETYTVPVTKNVKYCVNGQCFIRTVTEYVQKTRRVPRPVAVERPAVSEDALDLTAVTELVPTPHEVVRAMLNAMDPPSSAKFFDLGCGDGRFLIEAAKNHGCTSVGIDLNPASLEKARRTAELEFVNPLIVTFEGDVRNFDLSQAQFVTMYLYPELMRDVIPKLSDGTVIASYLHDIDGVNTTKHSVEVDDETHTFFVGVK